MIASEVQGNPLQFHLDHLGSPRVITGNGGVRLATHEYFPFGRETAASTQDSEKKKFTGHERDDINLDYMHARYYLPYAGRFLSVDPTWVSADLGKPQSWNRYSYVLNSPMTYTDPDGRCVDVMTCTVEGATLGGLPGALIGASVGLAVVYGLSHVDVDVGDVATIGSNMGGGSGGELAAETMIKNYQRQQAAKLDHSPIQASSEGGGGRTDRKLDKHTRATGQDKVDKLRGELRQLQATPNKTREVKEQVKAKERELKRAVDQQTKSEEHARVKQK
jgi:RHS repeat-associated protein